MAIWKPVNGYEGIYEVSDQGDIKRRSTGRNMALGVDKDGYLLATLCKDGIVKTLRVHRIVAIAFIPNDKCLPCINHKDENKANNNVDNLEWCSYSYNNNYGERIKKIKKVMRNNARQSRPVVQLDSEGNIIARYPSAKEAQRQTGFFNLSSACNKSFRHKTSGGFRWEWEDNYKQLKK